jgi:hypothetical protein
LQNSLNVGFGILIKELIEKWIKGQKNKRTFKQLSKRAIEQKNI